MAWSGFFEYDGNEIINVSRTEAYAKSAGLHWFRPLFKNDALAYMLDGVLEYTTPLLDDAPWVDDNAPESLDFYGFYPLDVTGLDDSSRTSTVTESLSDGGNPGRIRHATQSLVFNGILLARTEAGATYGAKWLRKALLGGACDQPGCSGAELCYMASPPDMLLPGADLVIGVDDDPEECLAPFRRSRHRVTFNQGPSVTSKRETSDGGQVWIVEFGGVAAVPWEYGVEVPVIQGLLDPNVESPWPDGVEPEGGFIDLFGFVAVEGDCGSTTYEPVYDPLCPAMIPPPGPPTVPLGCYTPPVNWRRRQFTIPRQFVPMWGDVVPKVSLHALTVDVRTVRLRFYADPFGTGDTSLDDPCAYCGDFVVSYIPANHTLTIDGAERIVYVDSPGGERRRADSLVFKTDGTPFEWPLLTCGVGYVVTIDTPQTQSPPSVDLSLFSRAD